MSNIITVKSIIYKENEIDKRRNIIKYVRLNEGVIS